MQWRSIERFTRDGRTLLAKRLGEDDGPQFVLVHGIGVASRYFTRLSRVLALGGGVHALELPGHGSAPTPREAMSVEDFAALVVGYLRSAGVRDPIVIGHSMGAQIATESALQAPDLIRRIVLMGAVVDPRERGFWTLALRLLEDSFLEPPGVNWIVFTDYLRCGPRWFAKTIPAMMSYRMTEALPRLSAETLVVRGMRDPIGRHDWGLQMTRLIPRARLVELERKAHVVMHTATDGVAGHIMLHAAKGVTRASDGERTQLP